MASIDFRYDTVDEINEKGELVQRLTAIYRAFPGVSDIRYIRLHPTGLRMDDVELIVKRYQRKITFYEVTGCNREQIAEVMLNAAFNRPCYQLVTDRMKKLEFRRMINRYFEEAF